jgi:hypothetical protein
MGSGTLDGELVDRVLVLAAEVSAAVEGGVEVEDLLQSAVWLASAGAVLHTASVLLLTEEMRERREALGFSSDGRRTVV